MHKARTFLPIASFVVAGALAASPASAQVPAEVPPRGPVAVVEPPSPAELPPPGPIGPPVVAPYRKPPMFKAGVAVTAVGVAMMLGAGAIYAASAASLKSCGVGGGDDDWCGVSAGIGEFSAALLGGFGLTHVIVGIPLIAVGAQPPASPLTTARLFVPTTPTAASSRSISLTWAF